QSFMCNEISVAKTVRQTPPLAARGSRSASSDFAKRLNEGSVSPANSGLYGTSSLNRNRWQMLCWKRLGLKRRALGFKRGDVFFMLQRQANIIQTLHQPPARVVIDLEGHGHVVAGDDPLDQVDGNFGTGFGF